MFIHARFWIGLLPLLALYRLAPAARRPWLLALGGAALVAWRMRV